MSVARKDAETADPKADTKAVSWVGWKACYLVWTMADYWAFQLAARKVAPSAERKAGRRVLRWAVAKVDCWDVQSAGLMVVCWVCPRAARKGGLRVVPMAVLWGFHSAERKDNSMAASTDVHLDAMWAECLAGLSAAHWVAHWAVQSVAEKVDRKASQMVG